MLNLRGRTSTNARFLGLFIFLPYLFAPIEGQWTPTATYTVNTDIIIDAPVLSSENIIGPFNVGSGVRFSPPLVCPRRLKPPCPGRVLAVCVMPRLKMDYSSLKQ